MLCQNMDSDYKENQTTMQKRLQINRKDIETLKSESLPDLSKIMKSGIIKIGQIGPISYPITNIHAYLYLYSKKQELSIQTTIEKDVIEFIDNLLTTKTCIQINNLIENPSDDALVLLDEEIIEIIQEVSPLFVRRYRVDVEQKYKAKQLDRNDKEPKVTLSEKNLYGVGNVIKLCIVTLSNQRMHMSQLQSLTVIREILFPVYFCLSTQIDTKPILQALKKVLRTHHSSHIEQELSKLFVFFYHAYWSSVMLSNTNTEHVGILEKQLTLLELIHFNIPYPNDLLRSQVFKYHIKSLLQFKGESKSSIHPLAIKIYERFASNLNLSNNTSQVFINLFNILSCYGSHLIKDVWQSFYGLIDAKQASIYQPIELIDIILIKLQSHENSNVIKNCLHEILQNQNSNRIFENTPSIIYNSLIRMLNLGVHYLDCMFHMDSKMYPLISAFFFKYINSNLSINRLQDHLNWLLEAILSKSNFDHALIALLLIFLGQKQMTTFLTAQLLESTKYLLANAYSRFPIRKRFQLIDSILSLILNNMDSKTINLNILFNYFILINEQYLIDVNIIKLKKILELFKEQELSSWIQNLIGEVIEQIKENINFKNEKLNVQELYRKIKIVELYQQIYEINLQKYHDFFAEMVLQFGQSQYKSIKQRQFIIMVYSLIKNNLIPQIKQSRYFVNHLDAMLNSIALYSEIQLQYPEEYSCKKEILDIVSHLFYRTYAFTEGESFKERQKERVVLARMLEWASDKLNTSKLALDIIIAACRVRIQVLNEKRSKPTLYEHYENLFEETLYELYDEISDLELEGKKSTNKCSELSKDKQLRLKVLLTTILLHDPSHIASQNPLSCSDIGDVVDRYDFQNYEEVCWMIQGIYSKGSVVFSENRGHLRTEQESISLVKQLQLLLENMVHNLEYSLGKKEIVAICECSIAAMFNFAYSNKTFSLSLVDFAKKLIKSGQSYLIFQRITSFLVTKQLHDNFDQIAELNCQKLMSLLVDVLSIEEYRGFDSAIYLYQQTREEQLYRRYNNDLQRNYEGAVPRFLFIHAFKNLLNRINFSKRHLLFLDQIIHTALDICMVLVAKQKMFLSGRNKLKLQMWQFLLIFTPSSLSGIIGKEKFDKLIVKCIESIGHNLISQIRYYSEIFLMRILIDRQNFHLITNEMLRALQEGLMKSIGNVNRTISYILASGITIKHISEFNESQEHFGTIKNSFIALYNSLLTYVGCSVAYFRGLSQFFCLEKISGCLQTKYVSILRQNFLQDTDAENLMSKLTSIITEYIVDIKSWQIEREILSKIPNVNYNVVSDRYYMDVLKQFSTELAKINKNLDGFTAYRYIWKKNVANGQNEEEKEEDEIEVALQEQQEDIYQRKIDPTLDYLYGEEYKSQLKLMVTSSKSEALIGHLARTGEIFGIEELIVPCRKVIDLDQFKSISVTAERWLKITDLGADLGQSAKAQSVIKTLIKYKSQGFEVIKLSKIDQGKNSNREVQMSKKCILLLDDLQLLQGECLKLVDRQLQIGKHFSPHVQASIFIWSYFKRHVNKSQ